MQHTLKQAPGLPVRRRADGISYRGKVSPRFPPLLARLSTRGVARIRLLPAKPVNAVSDCSAGELSLRRIENPLREFRCASVAGEFVRSSIALSPLSMATLGSPAHRMPSRRAAPDPVRRHSDINRILNRFGPLAVVTVPAMSGLRQ